MYMYMYIYINICVCIYMCHMCVNVCKYVFICIYRCMYVFICTCLCTFPSAVCDGVAAPQTRRPRSRPSLTAFKVLCSY